MKKQRSLRRRLVWFPTIVGAAVLGAFGMALVVLIFAVAARPSATALSQAASEAAGLVAAAPPSEATSALQERVVQSIHHPGVAVIPIAPSTLRAAPQPKPAPLLSSFFGFYVHTIPVRDAAIIVTPDQASFETFVPRLVICLVLTGLAAIAIARIIAGYLSRDVLDTMATITAELRRFGTGDFEPRRLSVPDETEFGELAAAYNLAAQQVTDAFRERVRVEAQIRHFVAEAGHELRSPLTVVWGFVDILRRDAVSPAIRDEAFASLTAELARMRTLVERLMTLARLDSDLPSRPERIDVADVVAQIKQNFRHASTVPLRVAVHARAPVFGDPVDVYECVANLVENALKYGAGSPVALSVDCNETHVTVRVADGGPGVAESDRERIFERFYRAPGAGASGSGLGLSIALQAALRLGGTLRLDDHRAGSTTFTLRIPRTHQINEPYLPAAVASVAS